MPDPQVPAIGQDVTSRMVGSDVSDLMNAPASAAPAAPAEGATWRSLLGNLIGGAASAVNPVPMVKALYQASQDVQDNPVDAMMPNGLGVLGALLKRSQGPTAQKAIDAYKQGRYSEAAGYAGATALPLVGPFAASLGEQIGTGDPNQIAHAVGEGIGAVAGPKVIEGAAARVPLSRVAGAADRASTDLMTDVIAPKGRNVTNLRLAAQAKKLAPEIAREEGMNAYSLEALSQKGAQKLAESGERMDEIGSSIDPSQLHDTAPVVAGLQEKLRKLTAESAEGPEAHEQLGRMGLDMPAEMPEVGTPFKELPLPYKQEIRRMRTELDEVRHQPPEYLHQRSGRQNMAAGVSLEEELSSDRSFQPAQAGAPVYHDIQAEKSGTTRQGVIDAIDRYIAGDLNSPIAKRVLSTADKRLRGEASTLMPPDAGYAAEDWEGKIGRDQVPGPNQVQAAKIAQALREVRALGPAATYDALRKIRQSYDAEAALGGVYSPAVTPDFLKNQSAAKGAADVAGVFREALGEISPEMKQENATYTLWKNFDKVTKAALERQSTAPKTGTKLVARTVGAVIGERMGGPWGAATGFVVGPMVDAALRAGPTGKIAASRALATMADALQSGDSAAAAKALRQLAAISGQTARANAFLQGQQKDQP